MEEQMMDWDALDAELGPDLGDTVSDNFEADLRNASSGEVPGTQGGREEAPEERRGYVSDEESPRARSRVDMGVFRDVVGDAIRPPSSCQRKFPSGRPGRVQGFPADSEPFSGLRISDREVSPAALNNILSETRFIRLPTIKTAMMCGKIGGSWATIGIVVEKGKPKVSAKGKNFAVWKLGTLDQTTVSMFLFGAAYTEFEREPLGATFAVLNSGIRPDEKTKDPNLSIFNRDQLMKLGMSMDFAFCSGKRKDGTQCPVALNKHLQGRFCRYHASAPKIEVKSIRPELSGGKLELVGPGIQRGYRLKLPDSPVKDLIFKTPLATVSPSQLQDLLSDPEKMPAKSSQGKRFLEVMAQRKPEESKKKGTKRATSKEALKKGKRVVRDEKNDATSKPKFTSAKKACKQKSDAAAEMLEIDMEDDSY